MQYISSAYGDGRFGPDSNFTIIPCTRAEMACSNGHRPEAFTANLWKQGDEKPLNPFTTRDIITASDCYIGI